MFSTLCFYTWCFNRTLSIHLAEICYICHRIRLGLTFWMSRFCEFSSHFWLIKSAIIFVLATPIGVELTGYFLSYPIFVAIVLSLSLILSLVFWTYTHNTHSTHVHMTFLFSYLATHFCKIMIPVSVKHGWNRVYSYMYSI